MKKVQLDAVRFRQEYGAIAPHLCELLIKEQKEGDPVCKGRKEKNITAFLNASLPEVTTIS